MEASKDDIKFFDLRWSERWLAESVERLIEKHNLTPNSGNLKVGKNFVTTHRLHKYGKLRKQLSTIFGQKISGIMMNRLVGPWERHTNDLKIQGQYRSWKKYTDSLSS